MQISAFAFNKIRKTKADALYYTDSNVMLQPTTSAQDLNYAKNSCY